MFTPMKNTVAASLTRVQSIAWTRIGWISLFAALTGLGAAIRIPLPFTPVPITLQTVAVLASGIVLGRDGIYSQILYLVLGGIGLPFFAGNVTGFQVLFGATGGYLIGFVAASALANSWVRPNWKNLNFATRAFRLFLVSLVIFIPGVLQLALVAGISFQKALMLGFVPFVVGDIIKVLAVAGLPNRSLRS